MLYTAIACLIVATAANKAEVSTGNLRTGASFDNLKASWGKKLSLGDFNTQLDVSYDYAGNKEFLKDATLAGSLMDASGDDVSLSYEVTKTFADKTVELKLTAGLSGTTVTGTFDTVDQMTEVSALRTVSIGDRDIDIEPSFLVKAQTVRVKLMSVFGKDTIKAQIDQNKGEIASVELGYERDLDNGQQLSATLAPDAKTLDLELTDSKFESGATWVAKACVPLNDGTTLLDTAKLTLTRAWSW